MERPNAANPAPEADAEANHLTATGEPRGNGRRQPTRPRRRCAAAAVACPAGTLASGDGPSYSAGALARPPALGCLDPSPGSREVVPAAECGTFEPWDPKADRGTGHTNSANPLGQDRTGAPLYSESLPDEMMAFGPRMEPRLGSTGAPR